MEIRNYKFNPYAVIFLVGCVTYFRALFFGFTYLDDNVLILDNLAFLRNAGNIFRIFTLEVFHVLHASAAYYRPILTLSFMIDSWISGPSPFFYHLTNIVLHIASASTLFLLLKKLKVSEHLALFFALVFAVHPALAQAVAWIPGRNDSLIALFFFAGFIFYLTYFETEKSKHLLYHLLFFFLAIFTKESAIFIPPTLAFYSVVIDGQKIFSNKMVKLYVVWGVTFAIWYLLRNIALSANPVSYGLADTLQSVAKNFPATLIFVGKAFLPLNLSTLPTLADSTLIYGAVVLCLMTFFLAISKPNLKVITFGLVIYLVFLTPSFIRPNNDYMADFLEHRQYLPILGLFIVLSQVKWLKELNLAKLNNLIPAGLFLGSLVVINFSHLGNFSDGKKYWGNAVVTSPSHPLAHKNYGSMYFFDKQYDVAEAAYKKSLDLNPEETMAHNNLGLIYLYKQDYKKSEEEFNKELSINPRYDNAHFNFGLLYYQTDQKQKAEEMWLKTLTINPDYIDAYKALAIYYSEIGDDNKSGYFLNEALKRGAQF